MKQKPQQEFISNILNYFPLYDCCINVNEILFVLNRYKSFQVSCCIIGDGVKIIASTEVDFCILIISGHSENTVYLERSDSCVNIHVLRQVALLSKAFSTDLARELLVRAVDLPVSAAQTRALEPLEADFTLERVSARVSSHVVVETIFRVQLLSTLHTAELLHSRNFM